jgi:hypothetical protein
VPGSVIRIAVVSDLHAHSEAKNTPSFLDLRDVATPVLQHPVLALKELISSGGLTADLLLSPGDLGHQASTLGIRYAWNELQDLGIQLGANLVTATAGNHDMDSRHLHTEFAADRTLKSLTPPFPLPEPQWDKYWARHFAVVEEDSYRLLLLNSSAYHGNQPNEKNHGRIDTFTLEQIENQLKASTSRNLNILLCHHHPHQHSEIKLGEDDVMKNGQLLLDVLGSGKYGHWIVIHGHKHHPKVTYAAGGSVSPVVFSAGSFSVKLPMQLASVARNQFYILEFDAASQKSLGFVGKISSWEYAHGRGWNPSNENGSGLPSRCGFGWRGDPSLLAAKIETRLGDEKILLWKDILHGVPEISYLIPQDFSVFWSTLKAKGIDIQFENNSPGCVARTK